MASMRCARRLAMSFAASLPSALMSFAAALIRRAARSESWELAAITGLAASARLPVKPLVMRLLTSLLLLLTLLDLRNSAVIGVTPDVPPCDMVDSPLHRN